MAQVIFTFLVLAAGVLIGLSWAMKEDKRREKEKKMQIPKHIEDSLDDFEKRIS